MASAKARSDNHMKGKTSSKVTQVPELLKSLEWSGRTVGQGVSMADSGPLVACCPICRGICPEDMNASHFERSAHGHREDCDLVSVMELRPTEDQE